MLPPVLPENIGVFQDSGAAFADKVDASEKILFRLLDGSESELHQVGKALCWLGYRHLEGQYGNRVLLLDALPEAFKLVSAEENQFHHYRWHVSLMTFRAYLLIRMGAFDRPRMLDGESLYHAPFTMVNVSRLCLLRAGDSLRAGDKTEAARCITHLHNLFPRFAAMAPLKRVAACAGHEICCVSRMVHASIMLLSHAGLPYAGQIYDLATVADIETSEPFRWSFRKVLGLLDEPKGLESTQ